MDEYRKQIIYINYYSKGVRIRCAGYIKILQQHQNREPKEYYMFESDIENFLNTSKLDLILCYGKNAEWKIIEKIDFNNVENHIKIKSEGGKDNFFDTGLKVYDINALIFSDKNAASSEGFCGYAAQCGLNDEDMKKIMFKINERYMLKDTKKDVISIAEVSEVKDINENVADNIYLFVDDKKISPFSNKKNIDCVEIELSDIIYLPKNEWYLSGDIFLLSQYYRYRHIIYGRISSGKEFIGVIGKDNPVQKAMAILHGFYRFEPVTMQYYKDNILSKNVNVSLPQDNEFGYWCHILDGV